MANLAIARPLGELHFTHQFRLYPVGVATERSWRRRHERGARGFDAAQRGANVECRLVREPGTHLSGEDQALAVVVADQQRADAGARPLRVREPANDELLPLHTVRLQPFTVTPGAVRPVTALGHDPFEACSARFGEECVAVALDMLRVADGSGLLRPNELLQPRLTVLER